jgi:hypothetical protein
MRLSYKEELPGSIPGSRTTPYKETGCGRMSYKHGIRAEFDSQVWHRAYRIAVYMQL